MSTTTPEPTIPNCGGCIGSTIYLLKGATDFDYYDPQRVFTGEDFAFFVATIMRSLVAYKYSSNAAEALTLVPDMATDTGTANADATSWSFTLRDGLTWQDGSPVKCEDVKYGVSRTFATDVINGGPTHAIEYLDIPKAEDGSSQYKGPYSSTPEQQALFDAAVICDGNKITFNLGEVVPDFNYATTIGFGAMPNPIDHPGVDTGELYVGDAVWSDGPYKITTYNPTNGGSLVLGRNDEWSQASDDYRGAYPDKWEVDFGLDPQNIDDRIIESRGTDAFALDYSNMAPESVSTVFDDPHSPQTAFQGRAFAGFDRATSYYWINTKTVPKRDIRAAMAAALDRDAIRANEGGAYVGDFADGAVNPSIGRDYAPTGLWDTLLGQTIPPTGDPEYATTLIAQSGETIPTVAWSYVSTPSGDAVAAIVQRSLEKAGFRVNLKPISTHGCAACNPDLGDFGAPSYPISWTADWPNASTVIPPLFTAEAGYNPSSVDDTSGIPDWTAQVNDARTTLDRAAQALKWQELNTEAAQQVWIIPTFFGLSQNIAGTNVGGTYRWAPYASWPYAQLYAKVN